MPAQPLVRLDHITKRFGAVTVLHDISMDLVAGAIHALVGENGAGKSTIVKILAGIYSPDDGTLSIDGKPVAFANPSQSQQQGIAVIHQQPSLFPDLSVAENIFMSRQPMSRLRQVHWNAMNAEANALLRRLDAHFDAQIPVRSLSIADQQLIEIAKALSIKTRLLVMDEPTAALSSREVDDLVAITRQLRSEGIGILFISHRFEEIFGLADTITILRDGALIFTKPAASLTPQDAIRAMVGREMTDLFPQRVATVGETRLAVRDLTRSGEFRDISFTVHSGEIVGFAGLIGAGRTEVARAIFGLTQPEAGTIEIEGQTRTIRHPNEAMRLGIAYVPEDRQQHGLIPNFSIAQNITAPIWQSLAEWWGTVKQRQEDDIAGHYFDDFQIHAQNLDQLAMTLSGGNQQKIVIAKWLSTHPKVLILDEPTRGIDVGAKAEVYRIIAALAQEGMAIMLISSELPEILGMSDRIVVMHEGRIVDEIQRSAATEERIMAAATGQGEH